MKPAFEYKGYFGSAEVSVEDNVPVGRLMFIPDVVSYVAAKPSDLEKAFREAVDDYLQLRKDLGDEPSVPCKGMHCRRVLVSPVFTSIGTTLDSYTVEKGSGRERQ